MFGIPFWIIKALIPAAIGAIIVAPVVYFVAHGRGEDFGRAAEQAAARQRAMELIQQRNEDNEEISNLDVMQLCAELGGRWIDVEQRCD